MMKKTLLVMGNEIRATLGRKAYTIIALGLPLLMGVVVLVIILLNREDTSALPADATKSAGAETVVGYVDQGGLIQTLPRDVPDGWLVRYPDAATAQSALEAGEVGAYYIIPGDYLETGDLTYVELDYGFLSDDRPDHGRIQWVLLVNLFGGDEAAATAALHPLDVHWQQATSPGSPADGDAAESWITEVLPNLMAFLLYMVILIPASALVNTVTNEKKNCVMEILLSSVSPSQLITGKILALGLLGLLQTALWAAVLWTVVHLGGRSLDIPPGFTIPSSMLVWLFVYSLLGYAMYGALMAGLGALAPELKDTQGATMVVLSPLIVVYVFLMVIVQRPDSPVSIAFSFFPLTSPVGMIARMTATDVATWQPVLAAALQLLTSILIVRLAARLFHAQHLLSGQPFSLRAYGNALLGRS
jgi:ABC-2 type transport system permease protein